MFPGRVLRIGDVLIGAMHEGDRPDGQIKLAIITTPDKTVEIVNDAVKITDSPRRQPLVRTGPGEGYYQDFPRDDDA